MIQTNNYSNVVKDYTQHLVSIPTSSSVSGIDFGDKNLISMNRLQSCGIGISIIRGVVLNIQQDHAKGRYCIDIQTNNLGRISVQAWDEYGDFANKIITTGTFIEMGAQIAQYSSTMEDTLYRVDKIKYFKSLDSYSIIRGMVYDSTPMRRITENTYEFYIQTNSPKGNGLILCTIPIRKGIYEGKADELYSKVEGMEGTWLYFRGAKDDITIPDTCWLRDIDLIEDTYEWNYN